MWPGLARSVRSRDERGAGAPGGHASLSFPRFLAVALSALRPHSWLGSPMTPGLGDRLKKLAKDVGTVQRVIADTDAVLHGRPPSSSSPSAPPPAAPPPPANSRCAYCGGLVERGKPKCPSCSAPM